MIKSNELSAKLSIALNGSAILTSIAPQFAKNASNITSRTFVFGYACATAGSGCFALELCREVEGLGHSRGTSKSEHKLARQSLQCMECAVNPIDTGTY